MSGNRERFTIKVKIPRYDSNRIRSEITEWLDPESFLSNNVVIVEGENRVQFEHRVLGSSGAGFNWTYKPIAIYHLTMKHRDSMLEINAEVEIVKTRFYVSQPIFWRMRCRDYLRGFFKRLGADNDRNILRELYPREEIENIRRESRRSWFRSSLRIHGLFTLAILLTTRQASEVIMVNVFAAITDFITVIQYLLETSKYRH